jgi:transcriptional regulator with XRE-family HTH domain
MARSGFSTVYTSFIRDLVQARKSSGLTQVELARRLSKPQSFISKIERTERRLDVVEFCAIAQALGREPPELLGELLEGLPRTLPI